MSAREQPVGMTVGDPYRLGRRIGAGNMGTVFDAHHMRLERRCVVKVMNSETADSAEAVARFHSQAEIASRLAHQNLVRVVDFGTAPSGEPFLVMERLEGEDLGRRLQRTRLVDPAMAAHICRQVAAALAAAHDRGVVHGAVKPSNIFLVPREGELDLVKVLDCGTAQVQNARTLKHPSALEDTLPYVAPEQAGAGGEARAIDPQTDQWGLACVAWHMVTGRPPFAGEDATALLYQVAYEDPLPPPEGVSVPQPVMKVLRQALSRRPDNRFADITAFARALVEVAGTPPAPPKPVVRDTAPAPTAATSPAKQKSNGKKKPAPAQAPPRTTLLGMPTMLAPSEPVFLPGVSHRAEPRSARGARTTAAAQTRVQGLRVRTSQDSPAEAPTEPGSEPDRDPGQATLTSSSESAGSWGALRKRATAMPRRKWMLVSALPVGLAVALLISWSLGDRRPPVSVERTPTTPPVGSTESTPTSGPRKGGSRAVIVPLASRPRGPVVTNRRRSRLSRAKRAALVAKARRADNRARERGANRRRNR